MFDWLKDILKEFWTELKPWVVIDHYDRGVRLRLGKYSGKVLDPGPHWKLPFIDEILTVMVKPTTVDLTEQTVTTANNVQLVIEGAVKYEVKDAAKLLLEVNSAVDALADMTKGIIRNTIILDDWPAVNTEDFNELLTAQVQSEAEQWGLNVLQVTIISMAPMRSIRLLQTYAYKQNEQR